MAPKPLRQNETGRLGRVIVKHVRDAFVDEQRVDTQWRELNYPNRPDFPTAIAEYDAFADTLTAAGAELCFLPPDDTTGLDSLYPRDAAVTCDHGVILCSMGKPARRGEPAALRRYLDRLDIPVCGEIAGTGLLEGGDVVWLGERILAVGQGYRTNAEGIAQLRAILRDVVDEIIVVPLPHWHGPDDVFHLMSIISPIDTDLAAVYSPSAGHFQLRMLSSPPWSSLLPSDLPLGSRRLSTTSAGDRRRRAWTCRCMWAWPGRRSCRP